MFILYLQLLCSRKTRLAVQLPASYRPSSWGPCCSQEVMETVASFRVAAGEPWNEGWWRGASPALGAWGRFWLCWPGSQSGICLQNSAGKILIVQEAWLLYLEPLGLKCLWELCCPKWNFPDSPIKTSFAEGNLIPDPKDSFQYCWCLLSGSFCLAKPEGIFQATGSGVTLERRWNQSVWVSGQDHLLALPLPGTRWGRWHWLPPQQYSLLQDWAWPGGADSVLLTWLDGLWNRQSP